MPVANVAAIPGSPSNDDAIQVQDSTGIESFSPLTGLPAGFTGTPQLFVRIQYDTPGSTWQYVGYGANDPDNRYVVQGVTGTANNPSFYFDPDTGIYSPGANELGLSTGGAARLTIDSAGNVAIPGTLGVTGAITGSLTGSASLNVLKAGDTMTGSLTAPALIPSGSTVPTNGVYLPAANSVAISTGGSGRLFVDASGRVGVGTTPSAKLHVSGTTRIINGDSAGASFLSPSLDLYDSTHAVEVILTPASGLGAIGTYSNHPFAFYTNNAERARIDSSGRLGIGTSSPSTILHVNTNVNNSSDYYLDTGATALIRNDNASGVTSLKISSSGNSTSALVWGGAGSETLIFANRQTERMRIDSSGRVGIGSNVPQTKLQVGDYSGANYITIGSSSSTNGGILFADGTTGTEAYRGYVEYKHSNDVLVFGTGGADKATIDGSGRLLVGTSSARASGAITGQIQLEGTDFNNSALCLTRNVNSEGSPHLVFGKSRSSSVGGTTVVQSGDNLGIILFAGADGSTLNSQAAEIKAQVDGTPGGNDMPGRLVFSTTADGASSPTERMRIDREGIFFTYATYTRTTANAANVYVGSGGDLNRSTSSIKYKTDVETLQNSYADAVLSCRPVWYRSICKDDDATHSWWGFIAEEVAEIDPRLVHWKTTEPVVQENGSLEHVPCDPEPEGVAYDRFVPHLLNLIKRQKEQIEAMEARLSALEAQ